jgi:hypothetical protein
MESLARYQRKSTLFRYKHRQRSTDNKLVHETYMKCFGQPFYEINERRRHSPRLSMCQLTCCMLKTFWKKKKHLNTMHATGRSCHSIRVVPVKNKREWSIREIILPRGKPKNTLRKISPITICPNKAHNDWSGNEPGPQLDWRPRLTTSGAEWPFRRNFIITNVRCTLSNLFNSPL